MFSVKDIRKLVVVSIIGACAVFVANLFLNFYLDIEQLEISKSKWKEALLLPQEKV